MIEVKIDIVSDDDTSQRVTMDTIRITKTRRNSYMVYGDDRSNVCSVENFEKDSGRLGLVKQATQSLIKSGNYCHVNIIGDHLQNS